MFRTFQFRLRPNVAQRAALAYILADCAETYNAALSERREAWKLERKSITYRNQQDQITELRKDERFRRIACDIMRDPLRRVDRAFKAFFRRCKEAKGKAGFPRFRSRARYDSFSYSLPRFGSRGVKIPNLGEIKARGGRPISGKAKLCTIKRDGKRWTASVVCDIGPAPEKIAVANAVGIDVGLSALATLSDGTIIENPRWARKHERRIAEASRTLARKEKRSNNRVRAREALRRANQRAANARLNYIHHASKWLVEHYDLIAHEDLKIANMARSASGTMETPGKNVAQKSGLNRSIMDAAWGLLIWCITFKAEYAGKWVVPVNPRNTSQMCSGCGRIVPKKLGERPHSCECGLVIGRDQNAGINIKQLALNALGNSAAGASLQNVSRLPQGS